ncbi:MAG: hypothetical protein H7Z72_08620 [Bacteroidetes bacterium]|nr:hypothetical protein [Fibrella sp.]
MNQLKPLVLLGLLLSGSSCNRFDDQQPTPDYGPPAGTVQALTGRYPQAQDILFTTLAPNQLWQATFTQQRQRYQALTSPAQLLTADQLLDGAVPDSLARLLESTVVAGGTFSNLRLRHYEWHRTVVHPNGRLMYLYADYTWHQQPYTVYWSLAWPTTGRPYYNLHLLPFQQTEYQTKTLTDIPELIRADLDRLGLTFRYAMIQVGPHGKRHYGLFAQQPSALPTGQYWQLDYNEDGQLLAVTNPQTAQVFQRMDQLPPAIQAYLQQPAMAGFVLGQGGGAHGSPTRHTYGLLSTYQVSVQKDNQRWLLIFSDNGQLISRSFLTYGSF